MFTGIVQFIFNIKVDLSEKQVYLYTTLAFLNMISVGDSVSINGICLTVTQIQDTYCVFQITDETINKTTLKYYQEGLANVELALKFGSYVGGHIMSGHVYQIGTITSILNNGDVWIDLHTDANLLTCYKGSIAINGVSLTVAEIKETCIRIALIPETINKTTFKNITIFDKVNVELDLKTYEVHDDAYYMRLAIKEGEKGRITSPPNPWVGCVIVKNNSILSTGYHEKAGQDHAEVVAIKKSLISVADSTVYVTLEPCCHFGRTGPCTSLLIEHKIKKVIVGITDPDSKVASKGLAILREAGIEVILIQDINKQVYEEVKYSLRQYIYQRTNNRPYCTLKIALTLDNCYRDAEGSSKWITHETSRKEGHMFRALSQAVIVGASTVEKDDPELTVRYDIKVNKQPFRVVIDGQSLVSLKERQLFTTNLNNTVLITSEKLKNKWSSDSTINMGGYYVSDDKDVKQILNYLNSLSIMHVLIEGGSKIQKSFCEEGLVNEIVIFKSSKIFGASGYIWSIFDKLNIELILIESKIITDTNDINDVMERYLVSYNTLKKDLNDTYILSNIDKAIEAFANGGIVLVLDDEGRENEGDLMIAASKMTEGQMTEFINHTTGIICCPMEKSRAKQLNLPLMVEKNTDTYNTAFTVSVDYKEVGTGVSSIDRLATIKALANSEVVPSDLKRPGHIFPLIAHPDGLTVRKGHTEAAIALCKLSNIYPRVAVIGELQNKDGSMKKRQQCYKYAKANNIPMITVDQLATKINALNEPRILASCNLQTKIGQEEWKIICYDSGNIDKPHKVFIYPQSGLDTTIPVSVRIHSECFTGDVFRSKQCDCGNQLKASMVYITNKNQGVIIFPSDHEGRGIGFVNKCKTYDLQKNKNLNTFEANEFLGLNIDARSYDDIKGILQNLCINEIELLTENPDKVNALYPLVVKTIPIITDVTIYNEKYLKVKKKHFRNQDIDLVKGSDPVIDLSTIMNIGTLRIAIVYAMWHSHYITLMRDKLKYYLKNNGIIHIDEFSVPGSNELPFKATQIAEKYDGIVCLGILIKGDTLHFENISGAVSYGIMQAQISTKKPILNHVLSCLTMQQVTDRITGDKCTLEYIAKSVIYMTKEN